MHEFSNGLPMVQALCDTHDIIVIQEHWLLQTELHKLNLINCEFKSYGVSAITDKIARGVLVGRPFGGVAILWKSSVFNYCSFIEKDEIDGRLMAVKLKYSLILLFNVSIFHANILVILRNIY